jgi:hypothetical protein
MKRVFAILASACLLLIVGCRDYDLRLEKTFEEMKYQQRLERNLETAPTKGLLQQELIYVRPPKGLTGPTKTFSLTVVEPGKFDLENSFIDQAKQASLHILARHKKPKAPPSKKGPAAAEPAARGDFKSEVIELVKVAYGVDPEVIKFTHESKEHNGRENKYDAAKLDLATKEVQIFLYGDKNGPYNVAMIFEYLKTAVNDLSPKVGLCLESFAVGEAARRAFSGVVDLEGGEEGADSGQPVPI